MSAVHFVRELVQHLAQHEALREQLLAGERGVEVFDLVGFCVFHKKKRPARMGLPAAKVLLLEADLVKIKREPVRIVIA